MAKIPYVGLNSPFGNRGPDRTTPMNADTRGIGSGLAAAAGAVVEIGGSVHKYMVEKQAKEDEAALMDFEVKASEIENRVLLDPKDGAMFQRGQNAIGIRERALAEYDRQASELQANLPESIRERATLLDKRRRVQLQANLFKHESVESDKYQVDQAVAGVENAVNNAGMYFTDSARVEEEALRARAFATKLADIRGDAPDAETRTLAVKKAVSDVYVQVIDRKLQEDPYEAERYATQNKDKMTSDAYGAVMAKVDPYVRSAEYDAIAADIVAGKGARQPGDFNSAIESVLETEGGFNASDGNSGAPVVYGLNAKYNPAEYAEAMRITKEQGAEAGKRYAAEVYREKYWNAAGIDSVPAALRGQMFDAAVNMGVDTAKGLYKKSGGDPARFAELRRQKYRDIVAADPSQAKYLNGWLARVDKYAGGESLPPPTSANEAIARMRDTVKDPRVRRELEGRIRFEFQLKDAAEQESRQAFSMSGYDRIMQSDGSQPIEKMFTPDEMRKAYEYGYIDNFRALHRMKVLGQQPQTDLKLYEELKREALLEPEKFKARNLPAIAAQLDTDALGRLMGVQAEMKKGGAQPEFITEQKQLSLAYTDMGLEGKGDAAKRDEFERAYYKEIEARFKATGKKPSQQERQEIINQMKLPFVREGWIFDDTVPAYQADPKKDKVPTADRDRIIADLRKAGVAVTEQRIVEVYLNRAGSDL